MIRPRRLSQLLPEKASVQLSEVRGILLSMTDNPWESCDLPVLKAVVDYYIHTGESPGPRWIERRTSLDEESVRRALRALHCEPFFEGSRTRADGDFYHIGTPTGSALRAAERWPSPEVQLGRLIAAFEAVADDETLPEEERSRASKIGLWLTGTLHQVAIGALGGAGGDMITGG